MSLLKFISRSSGLALALLFFIGASSHASTWVGNGGNAGDVEWLVTLRQISSTLSLIEATEYTADYPLCKCTENFASRKVCQPLETLTAAQVKFCGDGLKKQVRELRNLIDSRDRIRVEWTTDRIEVMEHGRRLPVDAVADRTQGRITLNPDTFRAMSGYERIFLVTHELFHFTDFDGKPLTDEGAIGSFAEKEGSRDFINSMASAVTVQSQMNGINLSNERELSRPQGWRKNWIDLRMGWIKDGGANIYSMTDYSTDKLQYRHFFGNVGLSAGYKSLRAERKLLSTIVAEEKISVFSIGGVYRYFPFSNPLTYWGQSHLVVGLSADLINGEYNIRDNLVGGGNTSTRTGASADISYYVPLFYGFWGSVSATYQALAGNYQIGTFSVNNDNGKNKIETSIGASYAF